MIVHTDNQQKDVSLVTSKLPHLVGEILNLEGKTCDEVAIHFVSTNEISRLHDIYFNDPSVTDCITLPLDSADSDDYCILGDVFVCPQTAKDYISSNGGDLYEEITLYVIHGILHLLEYDDIDVEEEKIMRQAEARHLDNLKKKNLMLSGV